MASAAGSQSFSSLNPLISLSGSTRSRMTKTSTTFPKAAMAAENALPKPPPIMCTKSEPIRGVLGHCLNACKTSITLTTTVMTIFKTNRKMEKVLVRSSRGAGCRFAPLFEASRIPSTPRSPTLHRVHVRCFERGLPTYLSVTNSFSMSSRPFNNGKFLPTSET